MATIRPSSDLRNNYNEISRYCHTYGEPVYITKNGAGDLVVLSNEAYERLTGARELHARLDEGLAAMRTGKTRSAADVFAAIEGQAL